MNWNIAPECISLVVLSIIWLYSRRGTATPSLKNKLFQACFFITFFSMLCNILSTLMLFYLEPRLIIPVYIVTLIYFAFTPLMGMVYFFYSLTYFFQEGKTLKRLLWISSIPAVLYLILVVVTPWNDALFSLSVENGYHRGFAIAFTYYIFYAYCLVSLIISLVLRRQVQGASRVVLTFFPLVAVLVIVVQQFFPTLVLTGSAATWALLLIYLYLQNKQISVDYLTSLPNRQEMLRLIDYKLRRSPETPFSILVVSLREFSLVNDTYGQESGDSVLCAVSDFMRKLLTPTENALFRYSGDEFALVLFRDDLRTADLLLAMKKRFCQLWIVKGCTCMLDIGTGVAHYPESATTPEGLINGVEHAVNLAKSGENTDAVCVCNPDVLQKLRRKQQIISVLRYNLEFGGFEIYYQPIFSPETNTFVMAEALLRIPDSPIGPIYPDEFIPVAEHSGLIIEMTYWVLDRVCKCIRRLMDMNLELEGIGINFSPLQFKQADLIQRVSDIIRENNVPFSKIKIEVTESTLVDNQAIVTDLAEEMREMGMRIALDDFGTGYSNLISVTDFPLDVIKLDKSLVWSAMESHRARILVESFVNVFCQLGMKVLAEGVETQAQSTFVQACGCTAIQGFLYARPLPEDKLSSFLQTSIETSATV